MVRLFPRSLTSIALFLAAFAGACSDPDPPTYPVVVIIADEAATGQGIVTARFTKTDNDSSVCERGTKILGMGDSDSLTACFTESAAVLSVVPAHGSDFSRWDGDCAAFGEKPVCALEELEGQGAEVVVRFDSPQDCGDGRCAADENHDSCAEDCDYDLAVVVPWQLHAGLEASLAQYYDDLASDGQRAYTVPWTQGSVNDLKALIRQQRTDRGIDGALLLGNLPAAWYEQHAWSHEQFPCDVFLADLDATWEDRDNDGIYDWHSELDIEIFVSRLPGTESEIVSYFERNHIYRTKGSLLPVKAFLFRDDDWADYRTGATYGLESIYVDITMVEDPSETTRDVYLDEMTGSGAEFVYQWIHASPTTLYIDGIGGGTVTVSDIDQDDHKGSFFNLFDCSAARFTERCLVTTYLLKTGTGLATIGSTKTGGIYAPGIFHARLSAGDHWGESYRQWYNRFGRQSDRWHLGIVIGGDPLLRIKGDAPPAARDPLQPAPQADWTADDVGRLGQQLAEFAQDVPLGTFEEYKERHPQFFVP